MIRWCLLYDFSEFQGFEANSFQYLTGDNHFYAYQWKNITLHKQISENMAKFALSLASPGDLVYNSISDFDFIFTNLWPSSFKRVQYQSCNLKLGGEKWWLKKTPFEDHPVACIYFTAKYGLIFHRETLQNTK